MEFIVNVFYWLYEVKLYWMLGTLSTALLSIKINRSFFNEEPKDNNRKDWILLSIVSILFPIGLSWICYIFMQRSGIIELFKYMNVLTMNMKDIKIAIFKNVKLMGLKK